MCPRPVVSLHSPLPLIFRNGWLIQFTIRLPPFVPIKMAPTLLRPVSSPTVCVLCSFASHLNVSFIYSSTYVCFNICCWNRFHFFGIQVFIIGLFPEKHGKCSDTTLFHRFTVVLLDIIDLVFYVYVLIILPNQHVCFNIF
jgi:hypothetical protein